MSKLNMYSVSLKVRDIQVWQPSMALALVPVRQQFQKVNNDLSNH